MIRRDVLHDRVNNWSWHLLFRSNRWPIDWHESASKEDRGAIDVMTRIFMTAEFDMYTFLMTSRIMDNNVLCVTINMANRSYNTRINVPKNYWSRYENPFKSFNYQFYNRVIIAPYSPILASLSRLNIEFIFSKGWVYWNYIGFTFAWNALISAKKSNVFTSYRS